MSASKTDRPVANVPRIRSAYDGSRVRVRLICVEGEDRTQQQFKDECDINVLMSRYEKTGILPQGRDAPPQFLDVSSMDFTTAMNQIAEVNGVFSQLDARTRARFENNPELMLEFLADPANEAEAVKLGLREAQKQAPVKGPDPKPAAGSPGEPAVSERVQDPKGDAAVRQEAT